MSEITVPDTEPDERDRPRLCPGACNALYRKNGKGIGREGDPVLCPKCVSVLRNELSGLDTLSAMLTAEADGFRGSTGSDAAIRAHRNGTGRGSPSPVSDLLGELEDALRQWVAVKRPVAARLGYLARPVTESTSWLIANLNLYMIDEDYAAQLYDAVRSWHSRLAKLAKAGPALVSKPVPCPRCSKMGLSQERGSDVVKCRECGRLMSVREYEDLAAEAESATGAAIAGKTAGAST